MTQRVWTHADEGELFRRLQQQEAFAAIGTAMGRSIDAVKRKAILKGWTKRSVAEGKATMEDAPSTAEAPVFSSPYTSAPYSVEDIVDMFKIDLTVWEPYYVRPNVWQMGAKHPETGKILTENLYQTRVTFRRKPDRTNEELAAELVADILVAAEHRKTAPAILTFPLGAERFALEPDVFDVHLAKHAWKQETGEDYDTGLAEQVVTAAVSDLLDQARPYRISECVLPLGNDFFHVDNPQGETTAGTTMDRDTRFQRMFRVGCDLARWMIERCAEIAPTKVIVVPGNHDATMTFTMGVVMEAEFRKDKRVTFDNSPKPRKYHRYGKNLLGFTHGHGEKPDILPQLMAAEEPEAWALTTCREMHMGHFHVGKRRDPVRVDDKTSVTLRWIRSLSGTDAWHASKGFLGRRHAEAFLWREAGGMRAHFVTLPVDELLAMRTEKRA